MSAFRTLSLAPFPFLLLPPPSLRSPQPLITYLQSHNNRVQIQYRFPILPQNIQTHISLEVDIGVVDFLHTLDLWRIVREVLVDGEAEGEGAGGVHAFVGVDGEGEVEDVVGVGKGGAHCAAEGELGEVYAGRRGLVLQRGGSG